MAKFNLSEAAASAVLAAILTKLNEGTGPAKLRLYTGTMPTSPDTVVTSQVRLATLICSDPAAVIVGRTMTFNAITQDDSADATGVATWARFEDSDGTAVFDIDITTIGGGGAGQMPTTSIYAGTPVTAPSVVITA